MKDIKGDTRSLEYSSRGISSKSCGLASWRFMGLRNYFTSGLIKLFIIPMNGFMRVTPITRVP